MMCVGQGLLLRLGGGLGVQPALQLQQFLLCPS